MVRAATTAGRCPPEHWREWCLASVTTHDLPPTAGYLAGDHVRLQHQLGLLEGDLDDELAAGDAERDDAGWRRYAAAACSPTDADVEERSWRCTATSRSPRPGCCASR